MTPLAHRIVKELTLPVAKRTFVDQCGLLRRMDDVHCFEVTEVWPLMEEIRKGGFGSGHFDGRIGFAPAPRFWIEHVTKDGTRFAFHGEQKGDDPDGVVEFRLVGSLTNGVGASLGQPFEIRLSDFSCRLPDGDQYPNYVGMIYAALVIINSPRIIGRKQHMPHRGLERRLVKSAGMVGSFPLHAWTELKLSVADIGKRSDGTTTEAHLTGEKCLHFCRAHLRVKLGRLEIVRAHYRGNPALGIKRSRYRLAA
jgi:hypothetical protein